MRRLFEEQDERATSLVQYFMGAKAEHIGPVDDMFDCWTCPLNMADGKYFAIYVGPSQCVCESFLVWREIELHGTIYREAVAQYTEVEHRRKGYGRIVLQRAVKLSPALLSDREGLTYSAFKIWREQAQLNGKVLNVVTGKISDIANLTDNELWHANKDCEICQLIFL